MIASNQARNGTCRFKKAMMMKMMTAMIRDVRGQHFSLRTGRDKARQLFWGGAGQWSKSTGQGKAAVVPFQGGAKTM